MKLQIIEHNSERVLTTQQLAEQFGAESKRISENFIRNEERYTEGKHFYCLEGDKLKEFKSNPQFANQFKRTTKLYLWTKKGAWLHVKSLNTDEAWEAYERLVDDYYEMGNKFQSLSNLSPQLQVLINLEQMQREQDIRLTLVEQKQENLKEVVSLNITNWREDCSDLISKIALTMGGFEHIKLLREESYKLLNSRLGVDVGVRLTNKRRRMAEEGICKSKRDKLNCLDVIGDDKKLITGYVSIIKDMAVKYHVLENKIS